MLLAAARGWGKGWPENLQNVLINRGYPSARCWKLKELKEKTVRLPSCAKTPFAQKSALSKVVKEPQRACCQTQGSDKLGSTQRMPKSRRNGKKVRLHSSSLKQRGKWGLPCMVAYLSGTSSGIRTPLVSTFFEVWPPFGDFWGCFLGRGGDNCSPAFRCWWEARSQYWKDVTAKTTWITLTLS